MAEEKLNESKINPKVFEPLDDEEKILMGDIEEADRSNNLVEDDDFRIRKKEIEVMVRETLKGLRKDKMITIRMPSKVIQDIQEKAEKVGLPYQTVITTVLYQYSTDRIQVKL